MGQQPGLGEHTRCLTDDKMVMRTHGDGVYLSNKCWEVMCGITAQGWQLLRWLRECWQPRQVSTEGSREYKDTRAANPVNAPT
ncbi:hypothetical protein OK016_22635 [Vibrio chagasii]|nr:hypothetical protein [Vibrio chagasii]